LILTFAQYVSWEIQLSQDKIQIQSRGSFFDWSAIVSDDFQWDQIIDGSRVYRNRRNDGIWALRGHLGTNGRIRAVVHILDSMLWRKLEPAGRLLLDLDRGWLDEMNGSDGEGIVDCECASSVTIDKWWLALTFCSSGVHIIPMEEDEVVEKQSQRIGQ
jgi:hypothetical protein